MIICYLVVKSNGRSNLKEYLMFCSVALLYCLMKRQSFRKTVNPSTLLKQSLMLVSVLWFRSLVLMKECFNCYFEPGLFGNFWYQKLIMNAGSSSRCSLTILFLCNQPCLTNSIKCSFHVTNIGG